MEENIIEKIKEILTYHSFLEMIESKEELLVSDRIKSDRRSGGAWLITTNKGEMLFEGSNTDFDQIECMYSHRVEIFGVLIALLFLETYSTYYL